MNETQSNTMVAWVQATPFRKNILTTIFVFIALALIAQTVLTFKEASYVGVPANFSQSVLVTGKAEEYVKPDTLQFNISINEEGKDVGEATIKSSEKIKAAIVILKANGVEEKNIKTTNYSVTDKYESVPCVTPATDSSIRMMPIVPCSNSQIVGSIVYQTLEVKIRDIEKNATTAQRSKIIGELAASNIKTDGFLFTIFDIESIKVKVRAEAIQKAKDDARILSRNLGIDLGKVAGFTEQDENMGPSYGSVRSDMMMAKGAVNVPTVELPSGEQKVTSTVVVTYLIK